jgi:CheY-like chemotaxis protein
MVTKRTPRPARTRNVHANVAHGWTYSVPRRATTNASYIAKGPEDTPKGGAANAVRENTETVLLAEDDDAVRKIVARMLESAGFVVLTASSAAEAEQAAEDYGRPIHLLLADVVMPQASGRELLERLQKRYPAIRVLYMSGYTDEVIVQHGVKTFGMAFLSKPFTRADLTRKIRAILDN